MEDLKQPSTDEVIVILEYLVTLVRSRTIDENIEGATPHSISKKAFKNKTKRPQDVKNTLEYIRTRDLVRILGKGGTGTLYCVTEKGFDFYHKFLRNVRDVLKK